MRVSVVAAAVVVLAASAGAQGGGYPKPELRPLAGAYVPTGSQAGVFSASAMVGSEVAFELNPWTTVLGSFGWAPTKDKVSQYNQQWETSDIYGYDVGVELARPSRLNDDWQLKPFAGVGLGGRTYNYKDARLTNQSVASGYAALGTEFQMSPIAFRFELRDYLSNFTDPVSLRGSVRNDLAISAGFAIHMR